jgi:RNA polymerase sigma-70 factor (ECF subfamily)
MGIVSAPPQFGAAVDADARSTDLATKGATFAEFYEEHVDFVWRNVRRLLRFDAQVDDVTQEVFLVAMRRLDEFEGRSSARTWLYAILRRVVSDHRRARERRKIRDSADLEEIAAKDGGPHRSAERAEAVKVLHELLDKLDENKREVFILSELEQMTGREIAESLGITLSTVNARLRDAREELEVLSRRYLMHAAKMTRGEGET